MAAVPFPADIYPRAVMMHPENMSRTGGVATNGQEQIVGSGVGRWRATLSDCPVHTPDQILAYRAFIIGLQGRAGRVLVPAFDWFRANWPVDQYGRKLTPAFTRRRQLDGTQYEDPAIPPQSAVIASISAPALLRATAVQIAVTQGSPVKAGQYFSIGNRLHAVTEVIGAGTFRIWPGLRGAVAIGQAVNFTTPVCEMRLTDDGEGELELERGLYGRVTLNFVEVF